MFIVGDSLRLKKITFVELWKTSLFNKKVCCIGNLKVFILEKLEKLRMFFDFYSLILYFFFYS